MVPFGGFSMPVQYADLGVGESHQWTREKCSLFDVGHMYVSCTPFLSLFNFACWRYSSPWETHRVQHHISGPGAAAFLEIVTPTSTAALQQNHSTLSCLLHPTTGGIVDDSVITRLGPELFYVVTNAACQQKDHAYLDAQIEQFKRKGLGAVDWQVRNGQGLIAVQGPLSAKVLEDALILAGVEDLDPASFYFGQCRRIPISLSTSATSGVTQGHILVSRGGYTGEDGFEISIPPALTLPFTQHLLGAGGEDRLRLAGLGARDSLRLEAGMCLYGHDLNDETTPVEAGLSWVVHKDRRAGEGGFHGAETILRQLRAGKDGGGVERRRVGLLVDGAPAREGADIVGEGDAVLGKVTSGCPSPTLGKNIAMGYVKSGMHKAGTEVGVVVRGKRRRAVVTKMPFVKSNYWKQAAGTSPG